MQTLLDHLSSKHPVLAGLLEEKKIGCVPYTLCNKLNDKPGHPAPEFLMQQQEQNSAPSFSLNQASFGETFHVGAALLILGNQGDVDLSEASLRQIIFLGLLLPSGQITLKEPMNRTTLAESTRLIGSFFKPKLNQSRMLEENKKRHAYFFESFTYGLPEAAKKRCKADCENLKIKKNIPSIILFIRRAEQNRDMTPKLLKTILSKLNDLKQKLNILLMGNELTDKKEKQFYSRFNSLSVYDLCDHEKKEPFTATFGELYSLAGQIYYRKVLHDTFNVRLTIGMKSGALDGAAFCGMKTVFFNPPHNQNRMADVCDALYAIECDSTQPNNKSMTELMKQVKLSLSSTENNEEPNSAFFCS